MKRKFLIPVVFVILAIMLFAISVSAEECEHSYDYELTLGSAGFLDDIKAKGVCSACGNVVSETIPSIFITRGYSYTEGGIAQGYGIDREALARYEALSGEKVYFGGVLAVREVIGNKNPLNSDGTVAHESVQSVDLTDTEYSVINIMVNGIPEGAYDSIGIVCAMYVRVGSIVTYIDNRAEKALCSDKTYNEVVAKPEAENGSLNQYTVIDGKRYYRLTNDELKLMQGYFWNNSNKAPQQNGNNTTFNNKYWTPSIYFTPETLPNGSIIVVDSANGWQYRPHKWTGTRPDNTKEARVVVDSDWWGSYSYVGFNISKYTKGTGYSNTTDQFDDISTYTAEQILEHFQIYVPIGTPLVPDAPVIPDEPDEPDTPDTPTENPDYSDQKQDWNDDGELKILAIGNSFSVDSLQHLYQIAQSAGISKVTIGNLYIGGCSIATHLSNAKDDKGAYTYYTNTSGSWSSTGGKKISDAVKSDDWDFISIQQASGYSGVASTYDDLDALISIVEPLNPSARIVWHMTWAYQGNSSHSDFGKYDRNQTTMYNAIVNAVQTKIVTNDRVEIVIPAGTAIQNARTSYVGDTLTRDGYHLSEDLGRFIGGLSYLKALTGVSIDGVTFAPNGVDATELAMAIESVNNACARPFEVTNSTYTTKPDDSGNQGGTEGGDQGGTEGGDQGGSEITPPAVPEGYNWLTTEQMGLVEGAYYQSDASSNWASLNYANNDFGNGFITTKKFTKQELPVGTIIVIANGWQYRPEGWIDGAKNSSSARPLNVTTERVVIDDAWWGNWTERAFNVSKVTNTVNSPSPITEQEKADFANAVFFIYVPTNPVTPDEPVDNTVYISSSDCDEQIVTIDGKQYRALNVEAMGYVKNAYYYSDKLGPQIYETGTSGTPAKFFATTTFTKSDIPVGAVIWVASGWQYRPEGWSHTGSRPGNIKTTYVTMDDAWWGSYTTRAFNISKTSNAAITGEEYTPDAIHEIFKIYIPIENIKD